MSKLTIAQQQEQEQAKSTLRQMIPAGSTVYTILRHVSQSGMSRSISLVAVVDGEVEKLDFYAARALGYKIDPKHNGVKIGGTGMDMGFDLVYSLSQTLYGAQEGYALSHRWI